MKTDSQIATAILKAEQNDDDKRLILRNLEGAQDAWRRVVEHRYATEMDLAGLIRLARESTATAYRLLGSLWEDNGAAVR